MLDAADLSLLTATNLTFGRQDHFTFSGCTGTIAAAVQLLSLERVTCFQWNTTKKWNEYTTDPLQIDSIELIEGAVPVVSMMMCVMN